MSLDLRFFYLLNNLTGQFHFFDTLVIFLAGYFQYFLIGVFLLLLYFSQYAKGEKLRVFWVTIISIIVARFAVVELIRFFYHRPRPFVAHQVHQLLSENEWSFPSGHSAALFAMAIAIYLYNKKWGVGFFTAALLINVSRVIAGVHYPSDILGGMIVGIVVAYVIFSFAERKKQKKL